MDTIKYLRVIDDRAYVYIRDTWYILTGMVKNVEKHGDFWIIETKDIASGADNLKTRWTVYDGYTMDAGVVCHRQVTDVSLNMTTQSRFDASDIIKRSTWAEENAVSIKIELIYVNTMHEEWLKETGGKFDVYSTTSDNF